MSRIFIVLALLAPFAALGCSTAQYVVRDPATDKVLQKVIADAPGGETYVLAVYYGDGITPTVKANGDSNDLVNATASAGRMAVRLAQKAGAIP